MNILQLEISLLFLHITICYLCSCYALIEPFHSFHIYVFKCWDKIK